MEHYTEGRHFIGRISNLQALELHVDTPNNPPSPQTSAGVIENEYAIDLAGDTLHVRGDKIEAVFGCTGDGTFRAIPMHSRKSGVADANDAGADAWVKQSSQVVKTVPDQTAENRIRFAVGKSRWITMRIESGTIDGVTEIHADFYMILETGGNAQAIG